MAMEALPVHYSYGLVIVSVLISILAAFAAFSLAERMKVAATSLQRMLWLFGGSSALGMGIWSMHYLGMLALQMPVPVVYHVPTVLVSLLLAVAASAVTLTVVSLDRLNGQRLLGGGVLMGAGIGGMHYVGMAAMRSAARNHYSLGLVLGSVVVAVSAATVALWIGFAVHRQQKRTLWMRTIGAVAMGLGIAAMHYTAMRAVCFMPGGMVHHETSTIKVSELGEVGVAVLAGLILIAALATSAMEKMRELREAHERLACSQQELLQIQHQLREANQQLSELSVRDGLTGLYNRRHFDMTFATEWNRAQRAGNNLALLMIDVDYFKRLNDRYGHQTGDQCLQQVARVLGGWLQRSTDLVARYGGEEFVVLLPDATVKTAAKVAEEIRQAIRSLHFANVEAPAGHVTVSIGVCCRKAVVEENPALLLRDADVALYCAKQSGRDRIMMFEEAPVKVPANLNAAEPMMTRVIAA